MKKGFQMFTVRELLTDKQSMFTVFKKVREIGYDTIQGYLLPFITLKEYKELTDTIGFENCSLDASFEAMRSDPKVINQIINDASFLGVDQISIGTLPMEYRENESGFRKYAQEINVIAKNLKKEGKKLLYHPHALEFFSFGGGFKGIDIILEETDPEGFWFCLDTHWLVGGGVNIVDWLYKVKGRMKTIHYKDYAIIGGAIKIEEIHKRFAEVGEGNIDWEKIIAASKDIGIEYAIVEQDICPGNPLDSLKTSFNNMIKFHV
ncbi:sugar phosphate isomerase/epimerase family protein [Leadbettera azotonutricia]|uniref:Putative xylose isomerase domain protein TIM barrel n=1 Tax=Leadbettera azotonutricia (strain ATCC BAA-888 / DSM 13862 / ZAS-9) TaxID=545695 RepID=F5Y893_LEAAZ|nr:sugar phosphate isomerase/epimerase [Leadbettera azotonutricia]AEF82806.1 putative xylose isomerase domain protein TIM barrel [Leadbettera azotonutricia ZAS-9]